ncbi:hypothetical protein [Neorhizobium sp. T25_13]|jgi:hypothetical protein|uniref:hypothetical protein n=1 Tax=Neorhizobium sp. T25_13 TaxID=2093830 RepID=UPI000CFA2F2A|nr:hypothetical protein [Neorhizobium sp. T25_13]
MMHIKWLLTLSDQELEDVMGAVEIWCSSEGQAIASDVGRQALELAAQLRRERVLSQTQLAQLLSKEMPERR